VKNRHKKISTDEESPAKNYLVGNAEVLPHLIALKERVIQEGKKLKRNPKICPNEKSTSCNQRQRDKIRRVMQEAPPVHRQKTVSTIGKIKKAPNSGAVSFKKATPPRTNSGGMRKILLKQISRTTISGYYEGKREKWCPRKTPSRTFQVCQKPAHAGRISQETGSKISL